MINREIKIIAGPCSINKNNIKDIYQIAKLKVNRKPAIWGTRVVGLKSRSVFSQEPSVSGMDITWFENTLERYLTERKLKITPPPSVTLAKKILKETHLVVATEIMSPLIQLPSFEESIFKNRLLIWNPAVNQLGWSVFIMGKYAIKNHWWLGLKNPKWVGEDLKIVDSERISKISTMEKSWEGLVTYGQLKERTVLIHRGVDVAEKGNYRNLPVHQIAKKVKQRTGHQLFFDPSHSFGPKLKDNIVEETVKAMQLLSSPSEFLYDGILIEVGTATTDSEQHISLIELEKLVNRLSKFRTF